MKVDSIKNTKQFIPNSESEKYIAVKTLTEADPQ